MTDLFLAVVGRMPTEWTCCKCGKTFPAGPRHEGPHGFKIKTHIDPQTGHATRSFDGDLCKGCMAPSPMVTIDYSKLEARVAGWLADEQWDANAPEEARKRSPTGRLKP